MTATVVRPIRPLDPSGADPESQPDDRPAGQRRTALAMVWIAAVALCVGAILCGFEPLFQQRTQSRLLAGFRTTLKQTAAAAADPSTSPQATTRPRRGSPVALLEIQRLRLQQVVVEGVRPEQTQNGPGHVPGSAGPGQPGNSVIVGRRSTFGGPFASLHDLRVGDRIVVTTRQGQSSYHVFSNAVRPLHDSNVDAIEGTAPDDRLTLVTGASGSPLDAARARVVVARMDHPAFPPTKQARRTGSETGAERGRNGWLPALVGLTLLAGAAAGAVWCYRNLSHRTAYLLTAVPLVVIAILASEAVSRMLPAWL